MLRIRESRAFTMIELIVVIVILGILATIAAVSYKAVIDNSKKEAVEQVAMQLGKEARALAAFKAGDNTATDTTPYANVDEAAKDLGAGVIVTEGADAGDQHVLVWQNGAVADLDLGASYTDAGTAKAQADVNQAEPASGINKPAAG